MILHDAIVNMSSPFATVCVFLILGCLGMYLARRLTKLAEADSAANNERSVIDARIRFLEAQSKHPNGKALDIVHNS